MTKPVMAYLQTGVPLSPGGFFLSLRSQAGQAGRGGRHLEWPWVPSTFPGPGEGGVRSREQELNPHQAVGQDWAGPPEPRPPESPPHRTPALREDPLSHPPLSQGIPGGPSQAPAKAYPVGSSSTPAMALVWEPHNGHPAVRPWGACTGLGQPSCPGKASWGESRPLPAGVGFPVQPQRGRVKGEKQQRGRSGKETRMRPMEQPGPQG